MDTTNAVAWYLDRHLAEGRGDAPFLHHADGTLSYRDVYDLVLGAGVELLRAGVEPEQRVVIALPDSVEAVVAILATMRIGAVAVPISPTLPLDECVHVVSDSRARAAVTHSRELADALGGAAPRLVSWVAEPCSPQRGQRPVTELMRGARAFPATSPPAPAPTSLDEPALISYTSGSTGRPKGVVHLHRGLLAVAHGFPDRLALTPDDRVLSTAKLSFTYGLGNSVLFPMAAGAGTVLFDGRVDPHTVVRLLRAYRPTVFCAVPSLYAAIACIAETARPAFESVRTAVSAGEHLSAGLAERVHDTLGITLLNGIGATECLHIFLATHPGTSPFGSSGTPVPGVEVRAVDESGYPVPDGELGRLQVRSPSAGARYWNLHEASKQTFTGEWVTIGDLVRRGPDGEWSYHGRFDDIVNIGGFKVAPTEVEGGLVGHPGVASCAVVGQPGPFGLTQLAAYVVPRPPHTAGPELLHSLRAHVRQTLPAARRPKVITFVEQLPTTVTGKMSRRRLREQAELEAAAS